MATASTEIKVTAEVASEHGLTADEYARVKQILGREPNITELGIFSVMWSEHCSYKSSKVHLKRLPTRGKLVVQGPGENAGVVDIGDGLVAAFKIESHNHPSFVEPFQGAATGVGGILRDIFTMGARPIAVLDSREGVDTVDIHQVRRARQAEIHQRNKALPAGEHLGVGAVRSEQREGLRDLVWSVVLERDRLHPLLPANRGLRRLPDHLTHADRLAPLAGQRPLQELQRNPIELFRVLQLGVEAAIGNDV